MTSKSNVTHEISLPDSSNNITTNKVANELSTKRETTKPKVRRGRNPIWTHNPAISGTAKLEIRKPLLITRRGYIDKINNFITTIKLDSVLFPDKTPKSKKSEFFTTANKAYSVLSELRDQLFELNEFIEISKDHILSSHRTERFKEKRLKLQKEISSDSNHESNLTITPSTSNSSLEVTVLPSTLIVEEEVLIVFENYPDFNRATREKALEKQSSHSLINEFMRDPNEEDFQFLSHLDQIDNPRSEINPLSNYPMGTITCEPIKQAHEDDIINVENDIDVKCSME